MPGWTLQLQSILADTGAWTAHTCDMADERCQLAHRNIILLWPTAAINHILKGHEQAKNVSFSVPEQPVAILRERYSRKLWSLAPASRIACNGQHDREQPDIT